MLFHAFKIAVAIAFFQKNYIEGISLFLFLFIFHCVNSVLAGKVDFPSYLPVYYSLTIY